MKKYIIILSVILIAITLTSSYAFNWNLTGLKESNRKNVSKELTEKEPKPSKRFSDFVYGIGPRFGPMKLSVIKNATSIKDFLEDEDFKTIEKLYSTSIIVIKNDKQSDIRAYGNTIELNNEQLSLIKSFDLSTNFVFKAEYLGKNLKTGTLEPDYKSPHQTIVPEIQARYTDGFKELKEFLRKNSKDTWENIDENDLQPAKLFFTVSKSGTIEDVRLDRTSNFPEVDKIMSELISKAPGHWIPAENKNGEKVDQEFVISFGLMGC